MSRLLYLNAMLNSWSKQTERVNLCVVLSADSQKLLVKCYELFAKVEQNGAKIVVLEHAGSQFAKLHYAIVYMSEHRLVHSHDWICFSDDDDLWHPDRVHTFNRVISHLHSQDRTDVKQFTIPWACEIDRYLGYDEKILGKLEKCLTPAQIDQYMHREIKVIKPSDNMWTFCVRFRQLLMFVVDAPLELLGHKKADVAFTSSLYLSKGLLVCDDKLLQSLSIDSSKCWMYFYRLNSDINQVCLDPPMLTTTFKSESWDILVQLDYIKSLLLLRNESKKTGGDQLIVDMVDDVKRAAMYAFEKIELRYMFNVTGDVSKEEVKQLMMIALFQLDDRKNEHRTNTVVKLCSSTLNDMFVYKIFEKCKGKLMKLCPPILDAEYINMC